MKENEIMIYNNSDNNIYINIFNDLKYNFMK